MAAIACPRAGIALLATALACFAAVPALAADAANDSLEGRWLGG